jgi:hypothetical protein
MPRTNIKHKAAASPKGLGLAKRVQYGNRVHFSRMEFALLLDLWVATNGKPNAKIRNALARRMSRYVSIRLFIQVTATKLARI